MYVTEKRGGLKVTGGLEMVWRLRGRMAWEEKKCTYGMSLALGALL